MPDRSPLALAALASAAMRDLDPATAHAWPSSDPEVDAAVVRDVQGRDWLVRASRTQAAGVRLDDESRLLAALGDRLGVATPQALGTVALLEGGSAVVSQVLQGQPLDVAALVAGPGLGAELGRVVAAVHDLPQSVVSRAGLPVYTAEEYRLRRVAELDRAAATGQVPPGLLTRWEKALEEAGAWRFVPCVVHGDLAAASVLVHDDRITAVCDWGEARVGDPADDFAWLAAEAEPEALESVLEAYALARHEAPDRDLVRRARLAGELAVARWLLHGVTRDDEDVLAEAVAMLTALDQAVHQDPW